jgi:3-aminobutyryl-CoA ammonia-lyase
MKIQEVEVEQENEFSLIVRIGWEDAHYSAGLVAGGHLVKLFGDVATILMQKYDGDGGLLAGYEITEFTKPVYAGDVIEVRGKIVKIGKTSRKMEFTAWKILQQMDIGPYPSSGIMFEKPIKIGWAIGTGVVKKEKQWLHDEKLRKTYPNTVD